MANWSPAGESVTSVSGGTSGLPSAGGATTSGQNARPEQDAGATRPAGDEQAQRPYRDGFIDGYRARAMEELRQER
jgi:hypothetical protein